MLLTRHQGAGVRVRETPAGLLGFKGKFCCFFLLFNLMNVSDQLQHSDSESTAFRHECRNHANLFGAQGF